MLSKPICRGTVDFVGDQCVKLTLARSPMATTYYHLATYVSFPSAILGDKVSGWLGCAAQGITCEPMRPSEGIYSSLHRFHISLQL